MVGLLAFLVLGLLVPVFNRMSEKSPQMQAANNCRQILISLKSYAGDNGGNYPDFSKDDPPQTSNDVLRQLIKAGLLEDARVFSAPNSPYVGDNNIGKAPGYAEALRARENHWAMTKGLIDDSNGSFPLLFENPAVASWPPRWDSRLVQVPKPGRVWKGGKIVVGRNDCSVNLERLAKGGSPLVTLEPIKDGKNLFDLAGPHEILDVAR